MGKVVVANQTCPTCRGAGVVATKVGGSSSASLSRRRLSVHLIESHSLRTVKVRELSKAHFRIHQRDDCGHLHDVWARGLSTLAVAV
jgi:hypothetical protein